MRWYASRTDAPNYGRSLRPIQKTAVIGGKAGSACSLLVQQQCSVGGPSGVWNLSRTHYQAVLPPSNHYFPYCLGWANWLCVMPLHCFSLHQARRSTSVLLPLRKQGQYRGHATSHRQCEPLINALVSSTGQRSERSQTRNPRTLMTRTPFPCTRWCAKRTWAPKVERWNTSRFIQSS
jgi:hypothetical protein